MQNWNKKDGVSIIGIFFLGVFVLFILSYFNVSVKNIVESPTGQENVNYVKGSAKNLWTTYLVKPATYLWNDIWINIFWKGFVSNIERIRDGKPTDLDEAANNLKVLPSKN
jgi:hypothetical protein